MCSARFVVYDLDQSTMSFLQYIFRFLYIRNWHTGRRELSPVRLFWFLAAITIGLISLLGIFLLQLPVTVMNAS